MCASIIQIAFKNFLFHACMLSLIIIIDEHKLGIIMLYIVMDVHGIPHSKNGAIIW